MDLRPAPFEDALGATNAVGDPDHRTRIAAAEFVLDRLYGKAARQDTAREEPSAARRPGV